MTYKPKYRNKVVIEAANLHNRLLDGHHCRLTCIKWNGEGCAVGG